MFEFSFRKKKRACHLDRSAKVNQIKNLIKKQKIFLSLFSIILSLFIVGIIAPKPNLKVSKGLSNVISFASIDNLESDFKNIERFEVPNSKGTVIFIPQIHKEPTTDASDPKNDQALVIQKEMYGILDKLVQKHGVSYVMDETDIYGPMPDQKVLNIKSGLEEEAEAKKDFNEIVDHYLKAGGSEEVAGRARAQAKANFDKFERNIYLTGSAAVLAAENSKSHVYGSQNPATLTEAKRQLQDIVYMENRIAQLNGSSSKANRQSRSTISGGENYDLQKILTALGNGSGNNNSSLKQISAFAKNKNDQELSDKVKDYNQTINNLLDRKSFESSQRSASGAPNIETNPYSNINDLSVLKKKYDNAYNKFMLLAKDQRSQEVSDNVERMMIENSQKNAVLVLGAQHKDQVVKALNKKNLNVIVITPEAEKQFNLQ